MSSCDNNFSRFRKSDRVRNYLGKLTSCLTFVVKQIRRPLIAYVVVLTGVLLAFALFQFRVNERLQGQDYKACMSRNDVLRQANERNANLVTKDGKAVKVYKLTNCEPLKP